MNKRLWIAAVLVLGSVLLDQLTKWLATQQLSYGESVPVLPFFSWTLLHNPGAAFSFLADQGGWQRWFFTGFAAVVSLVLAVWIVRLPAHKALESMALALVLGGALGNLIDRVQFGYVVDFISLHYRNYYWPAFNVADAAICVGVGLLLLDMWLNRHPSEHPHKTHPKQD